MTYLRFAATIVSVLIIAPLLAGFLSAWHPLADSFAHFRVHGIVGAFASALLLLAVKAHRRAGAAAIAAIAGIATLGPALPWPEAPGAGAPLTLIQFNAYFKNETPLKAVDLVRAEAADAVALQEISNETEAILLALKPDYAEQQICRFKAVGGAAVISRHTASARGCGEGYAWMRIGSGTNAVTIVSLHLHWPYPHGQRKQIARIVAEFEALPRPVLVGGDFNAAPWSHAVALIAEATATRPARGLRFTWGRGFLAVAPWPLMPIDHVLLPVELAVRDVEVGPAAGSDHLPVIARLNWRQ